MGLYWYDAVGAVYMLYHFILYIYDKINSIIIIITYYVSPFQ